MLENPTVLRSTDHWPEAAGGLSLPVLECSTYHGERLHDGSCRVWSESALPGKPEMRPMRHELPLHLEIRAHSPTGFAWGYGGSGPAQLALALLMDALGDAELAQDHYQAFKWEHVAKWEDQWSITAREIREFVGAETVP